VVKVRRSHIHRDVHTAGQHWRGKIRHDYAAKITLAYPAVARPVHLVYWYDNERPHNRSMTIYDSNILAIETNLCVK
jgi:hypothetical protein